MGYLASIPDLNWFMVAKIDKEEIQSPLQRFLIITIIVCLLLITINVSVFGFFIWNQRVKMHRMHLKDALALRDTEEKFNIAFRMSPVSVTISSMNHNKFIDVNDTFLKDMEYSREEVIGKTAMELDIWASEEERLWVIYELKEKGKIFGKVISYKSKKGEVIYGLSSMSVVMVNGEPCNLSTVINITQNRKAEKKLIESEELFRKLFENMLNGFAYCKMIREDDGQLDFLYLNVNEAFETLTGLKNVTGKKASEVIPGIQQNDTELLEKYDRVSLTGKPEVFEIFVKSMEMWYSISVYCPQKDFFVAVFDVITERKQSQESLKKSEEQYRLLFESISDAVMISELLDNGKIGKFIQVNDAACKRLGYSREEMLMKTPFEINSEKSRQSVNPKIKNIIEEKHAFIEAEHVTKDGRTIPVEISTTVTQLNNKTIFLSIARDISERKLSEEKLRETNEYLTNLFNYANAPIIVWDTSLNITQFNHAFERLSGYFEEEVLGKKIDILFPAVKAISSMEMINRAVSGERWETVEIEIQRKDGSSCIVLWNSANILDRDGKTVVATIAQGHDITLRKRAEAEIRLQSEILSHMAEAVYLVKMNDGIIVFANSKFESMFGYDEGEMIGKHVSIVNAPTEKSPEETARKIMNSLSENGLWIGEILNIKKDGTSFWTQANVTIFDHSQFGEVLISVQNDITDRKNAETQIKKLNEDLEERVIQRTEQLAAANKELEAFSYSVSHDLRAPLRAVHSYTNILLEDYEKTLDDEGRRICRIISSSATQMGELIDDLLSFSRVGRSTMKLSVIDMKRIVSQLFDGMTSPVERERIVITIGKLQKAYGDITLIGQVWVNLLSNAIKYSSKKEVSDISVGSHVNGQMVTYSIKDNGVGFDMTYVHKLFGVFQRLHSEREFEGNGVGLAIVQRIINKHGGKVWAEGEVGKGATFYFSLPASGMRLPASG